MSITLVNGTLVLSSMIVKAEFTTIEAVGRVSPASIEVAVTRLGSPTIVKSLSVEDARELHEYIGAFLQST